jgi:membrane carboxypeptidase/penicillin-binding protein
LIQDLKAPSTTHGMLGWHTTNALWWGLVAIHMSEEEQVTLIASRSYMGNHRYGLSVESRARFGRPLNELSLEEMATLVAIISAPSLYLLSPERLNTRKEWLIQEFLNDRSGR